MVLLLEYLAFFGAVFCTEQVEMICRMNFDMFFAILIFNAKRGLCMGCSLCIMADFLNGPISRIVSFFLERFFAQINSK